MKFIKNNKEKLTKDSQIISNYFSNIILLFNIILLLFKRKKMELNTKYWNTLFNTLSINTINSKIDKNNNKNYKNLQHLKLEEKNS